MVHIGGNMANKEDIKWNEGGGVNYSEYILLYRFFFSIYSGNVVLRKIKKLKKNNKTGGVYSVR